MIELKITVDDKDVAHVVHHFKREYLNLCIEFCTLYMDFLRSMNKETDIPIEIIYAAIGAAMDVRIVDTLNNKEVLN